MRAIQCVLEGRQDRGWRMSMVPWTGIKTGRAAKPKILCVSWLSPKPERFFACGFRGAQVGVGQAVSHQSSTELSKIHGAACARVLFVDGLNDNVTLLCPT